MTDKVLAHLEILLQSLKYEAGHLDSDPGMHPDFGTIYISQQDCIEYEKILEKRNSEDYSIFIMFSTGTQYHPKILNLVSPSQIDTDLRNSLISPNGKMLDIPQITKNLNLLIESLISYEDFDFIETVICEALWDLNKKEAKNTQNGNRSFDQFVRDYIRNKRDVILTFLHKEQLAVHQQEPKWFNVVRRGYYFDYAMPLSQMSNYLANKKKTSSYLDCLHFMKISLEIRGRREKTGLFDPLKQIRKRELRNMKLISMILDKEILAIIGNSVPASVKLGKPDPENLDGINEVGSGKSGRKSEIAAFKYLSTKKCLLELFNYLIAVKWIEDTTDYTEFEKIFSGSNIDHGINPITWVDTKTTQPNVNIAGTLTIFIHILAYTGFLEKKYLKPANRNPVIRKSFKMLDGSEPNLKNMKYNAKNMTTKTRNLINFLEAQKCQQTSGNTI